MTLSAGSLNTLALSLFSGVTSLTPNMNGPGLYGIANPNVSSGVFSTNFTDITPQAHTSIDYIWHLAAAGATYFCRDFPKLAVLININGTLSMLDIAINSKCKHFFFADSSSLYDSLIGDEYYPSAETMAPNIKTPMGEYRTIKLSRQFPGENKKEQIYWFAPELDFSIVRILNIDKRSSDLTLQSFEFID